jgi:hypothetical protein
LALHGSAGISSFGPFPGEGSMVNPDFIFGSATSKLNFDFWQGNSFRHAVQDHKSRACGCIVLDGMGRVRRLK